MRRAPATRVLALPRFFFFSALPPLVGLCGANVGSLGRNRQSRSEPHRTSSALPDKLNRWSSRQCPLKLFCIRRNQSAAAATRFPLSRTKVRILHTCSAGRNEPSTARNYVTVGSTCSPRDPTFYVPARGLIRVYPPAGFRTRTAPIPRTARSSKLPCSPSPPIRLCVASATPPFVPVPASWLRTSPRLVPFHPRWEHIPNGFRLPDRSRPRWAAAPATLAPPPRHPPCVSPFDSLPSRHLFFRTRKPRSAKRGFWSGGELREPRQCLSAFLEPCSFWGIRTMSKGP